MDETIEIDHAFYLCGRPDYERPGRGIDTRKTPKELTEELDLTKPLIVIDHEPRELNELSEAGVDLDLCGHTHDGQVFPLTLITDIKGNLRQRTASRAEKDAATGKMQKISF